MSSRSLPSFAPLPFALVLCASLGASPATGHAQQPGTCTLTRTQASGPPLGGDLAGMASSHGVVISGHRRRAHLLNRLAEGRLHDLRRGRSTTLGGPAVIRTYAGSPDGLAVVAWLDPRRGPSRRRPGQPTLAVIGPEGLAGGTVHVRGMRSLVNSSLAAAVQGRRIALVAAGPGQRPGYIAALTVPEGPNVAAAEASVQTSLLPGRISGTPALAWIGDRVAVAWASNDGGFGFVRLGLWQPGQTDAVEFRDVAPWRGEPPGAIALGASEEGYVVAWDVDEREGSVATTMVFVPPDPSVAATTLPMPWYGRAAARSSAGPWVTVAYAESSGALHVRVARGAQVADGVVRIGGGRDLAGAVVVPDGHDGATGVAIGADGSRVQFDARCTLAPPDRGSVATAGSVAPAGERYPSLMGVGGSCTRPDAVELASPIAAERVLATQSTASGLLSIVTGDGGARVLAVPRGERRATLSGGWPFPAPVNDAMVALDDGGDGVTAIAWVGPSQVFEELAPGPPAAPPSTRRVQAHPVYVGWLGPDGGPRGEATEILTLRSAEPRGVVLAAAPGQRAAVSVLDGAERARTRIAVLRGGAVQRVVPLGRRVDSGLGLGWSGESLAAAWAAGNSRGSGYVHVLRWPQAGAARPRWWIGGPWLGVRPAVIVLAADTSGTNVAWADRAPPSPGVPSPPADRTLAMVRVPLQDRAPSSREPTVRGRAVSLARGPGGLAAAVVDGARVLVRVVRQGHVAAGEVAAPADDPERLGLAVGSTGATVLGIGRGAPARVGSLDCTPAEPRTP